MVIDTITGIDLFHAAMIHDRHPIRHRECFALVVGDVDEGNAGDALNVPELGAHVLAELEVESGQGLIEQKHRRFYRQGTGYRNALTLTAGQLSRFLHLLAIQRNEINKLQGTLASLGLAHAPRFEPKSDVFPHGHVWE